MSDGTINTTTVDEPFKKWANPMSAADLCVKLVEALGLAGEGYRRVEVIVEAGKVPRLILERFVTPEDIERIGK